MADEASRAEQAKLREAAMKADAARRQEEAAKRAAARQQQVSGVEDLILRLHLHKASL